MPNDGVAVKNKSLQEAEPYYVRVISDTQIALYSNLHDATTEMIVWVRLWRFRVHKSRVPG